MNRSINQKPIQFVRELCKGKSEEEILEAEQNLRDFVSLINDIGNRIDKENEDFSGFDEL